jgi:PleD family two-component response regulator
VIAASYRNGLMVLILPGQRSKAALALGEELHLSISKIAMENPEAIGADHVTASVSVVTGRTGCAADRVKLLTRAIQAVPRHAAAGGDRVVPEFA